MAATSAVGALAGTTGRHAQRLLDRLTSVHLLQEVARDRYRFHDLLRVYAVERARADEPERDRDWAVRRVLEWYLHTADAADRVLMPHRRRIPLTTRSGPMAPGSFDLPFPLYAYQLVTPAMAIGLALLVLVWVVHSWAFLGFSLVYLVVALLRNILGRCITRPSPWFFLPHPLITATVLLLAVSASP